MTRRIVRGTCTSCGNAAHECECGAEERALEADSSTPRMFRVVLFNPNSGTATGTSSPFGVSASEEKAVAKAKKVALDYPPRDGCFAEPGVNHVEIQVQGRAAEGIWTTLRRFHRVARHTQGGASLFTEEL